MNILALNVGSSSLKFRLFQIAPDAETVLTEGVVERLDAHDVLPAAQKAIEQCRPLGIDAVGHRVVHGGARFSQPTRVTPDVLQGLHALEALDPLHNPAEVALIEATQRLLPAAPNVAVFDTAFHRTLPERAWRYALPSDLADKLGLRRYGFHGISHAYVSQRLLQCLGREAEGTRLVTCHLGSGASVCAVQDGQSVDTSMGMTPLEGLVMGTRSGDIDPGLLLYLMQTQHRTAEDLDDLLNHKSGLLGLSGRSADVRELEQAAQHGDKKAGLALDIFAYHVSKYIGAYAAVLNGVDAVAFAGGIGERSAAVRHRICQTLAFLGLTMDDTRNREAGHQEPTRISADNAAVQAWVVPTDEERQIARETCAVLRT